MICRPPASGEHEVVLQQPRAATGHEERDVPRQLGVADRAARELPVGGDDGALALVERPPARPGVLQAEVLPVRVAEEGVVVDLHHGADDRQRALACHRDWVRLEHQRIGGLKRVVEPGRQRGER